MPSNQEIERYSRQSYGWFGCVAIVIMLLSSSTTKATDRYWNVSSGGWSTATNWGGTEPTSNDNAYIYNDGTAIVTQSDESCKNLYLGDSGTGKSGTVQMTGGSLSGFNSYVGYSGTGNFSHTEGTYSAWYTYLGYNSSDNGSYDLSGSGQLNTVYEYIGWSGTGYFTHTAGSNIVGSEFALGVYSDASGTYDLSGTGQLSANVEKVGISGTGTFNHTAGTNTISYKLSLGTKGTYNLSGSGQLSAEVEYIGEDAADTALFQHSNGTNTPDYLKIGQNAQYIFSGGTLQIYDGLDNAGTLDLKGSSAVINAADNSIINFSLSGGVINNTQAASLTIGANSLLIVAPGFDPTARFATYHNDGILHTAGTPLTISSGQTISGWGTIEDPVDCQGTITDGAGGNVSFKGGLTVSGTAYVNVDNSVLFTNDTYSGISGGTLSVNYHYLGDTGTGVFTNSAGTNTANFLTLGSRSSGNGTYILSGSGQLLTKFDEKIGWLGSGTFNQSGGVNTVLRNLKLGCNSGTSGTYNLTGGTLILKSLTKGSGTAAFNFGGGTLQASGDFTTTLPMTLTGDVGNANIDTAGYMVALSSVLSGTGGLNKLGTGTLTLSALNTYGGDTTVNGGTLEIAGGIDASGTSLLDIQSGKAVLKTVSVSKLDLDIITADLATFEVTNGAYEVGVIDGNGTTHIDNGASLIVTSIRQGGLYIGSGAKLVVRPVTDEELSGTFTPVPEPSAFFLLVTGAFMLLAYTWTRKTKDG